MLGRAASRTCLQRCNLEGRPRKTVERERDRCVKFPSLRQNTLELVWTWLELSCVLYEPITVWISNAAKNVSFGTGSSVFTIGAFSHICHERWSWRVQKHRLQDDQPAELQKPNDHGTPKVDSTKLYNNVGVFEHTSNVVIFLGTWRCCWTFFWTASAFWKHHLLFHLLSHYLCRLGEKCRLSEIDPRVLGFGRVQFLIGVLARRDKVIHHAAMIWLHSPEQSHLMICPLSNWFLQLLLCRRWKKRRKQTHLGRNQRMEPRYWPVCHKIQPQMLKSSWNSERSFSASRGGCVRWKAEENSTKRSAARDAGLSRWWSRRTFPAWSSATCKLRPALKSMFTHVMKYWKWNYSVKKRKSEGNMTPSQR